MSVPGLRATRDSIRYGFAVGKVRVLETRLFGSATYERLLDAADFTEQRRILSDTIYGRYLDTAETTADVERGLDRALDDFYGFLDQANLPKPVMLFFRERYDFANLKGALKAHLLGTGADDLLVELGTIPLAQFSGPLEDLPEPFGALAARILGKSSRPAPGGIYGAPRARKDQDTEAHEASLQSIDEAVDRAMFAELAKLAGESKSAFLRDLAALQIDIANVKTLLRSRLANAPRDAALALMLKGGSIPLKELEELYEMPLADAGVRLASLPLLKGVSAADLADVSRLDVIADNVVVEQLRRARMVSIGAEPVIAYVMGREAEVVAVRTLLIGKMAGLSNEALRARLRDLYM